MEELAREEIIEKLKLEKGILADGGLWTIRTYSVPALGVFPRFD